MLLGAIIGFLILNSLPREKSTERNPAELELRFLQVNLAFNSRIPEREAWVSEDLKQYAGWIFIHQEIGACHITGTFQGFINCIEIRSDPWRKLPRRIVATLVSRNCLKRYFGLEWGEEKNESIAD